MSEKADIKTSEVRKLIRAEFPYLQFKVKSIGFQDLARCSCLFVSSNEWGMTKDNHETFQRVKGICEPFKNVVVSW
jgi:hypothetical protein